MTSPAQFLSTRLEPTPMVGVSTLVPDLPPSASADAAAQAAPLIAAGLLGGAAYATDAAPRAVQDRVLSYPWRLEDRIVPEMRVRPGVTHILRTPPLRLDAVDEVNASYTSGQWAGVVLAGAWTSAYGVWRIPAVSTPGTPAGADGTWNSSSWVGLDGTYGSTDVLQVGVQQGVGRDGSPFYVAWYEWYTPPFPNPPPYRFQVAIPNFPVGPGDEVVAAIEYRAGQGHVHFGNLSNGKYFTNVLAAPANASFAGNTAEWVMEAPNNGEPTTSLPKFTPVVFSSGVATDAGGLAGSPANGDTWNILRGPKAMTSSVAGGGGTVTIAYVGDDTQPKIGFNPQDRFMLAVGSTLVVVTSSGDVFGADIVNGRLQPVFQFTGAKIGFNPQDRFMVALGTTLVVVTSAGDVFGADIAGRHIGAVVPFAGAKIGFNDTDRFMTAMDRTLVVVTAAGDVFGADVETHEIQPVREYTGAKIGFNPQDRFLLTLGSSLVVVTRDGSVFAADVTDVEGVRPDRPGIVLVGREVGPIVRLGGAPIGYNPGDRFMMTVGMSLVVVTSDGDAFGSSVVAGSLTPPLQLNPVA